jgi:hypothetical protein
MLRHSHRIPSQSQPRRFEISHMVWETALTDYLSHVQVSSCGSSRCGLKSVAGPLSNIDLPDQKSRDFDELVAVLQRKVKKRNSTRGKRDMESE